MFGSAKGLKTSILQRGIPARGKRETYHADQDRVHAGSALGYDAAMVQFSSPRLLREASLTSGDRLAEYKRRMAYLTSSFECWRSAWPANGVNKSLASLRRSMNSGTRNRPKGERLHPALEMAVDDRARRHCNSHGMFPQLTAEAVALACRSAANDVRSTRGRPSNEVLTYHVRGMMVLCAWATGKPVTVTRYKGGNFDPQLSSAGSHSIYIVFRELDPRITKTTIADIICKAHASGALVGKTFSDLFPLYGESTASDPASLTFPLVTSMPSLQLQSPIYCL